jgi:hypothetical protein
VRLGWSMEQKTDHNFGGLFSPPPGDSPGPLSTKPVSAPIGPSQTFVGSDDMNVGFKVALADQDGCLPQMGIVGDMFVPTGSSAFTAGEVLPEIKWIYTWALTKKLSVTDVTFLTDAVDDVTNHTYVEFSQGIETDLALTDKIGS